MREIDMREKIALAIGEKHVERTGHGLAFARQYADAVLAVIRESSEGLLIRFMFELHGNVPEIERPMGRSDFSDEQWTRVEGAWRAMIDAASCDSGSDRNGEKP